MLPLSSLDRPTPTNRSPRPRRAKATPPPGKAFAKRPQNDRTALSPRYQQQLGLSYAGASDRISCPPVTIQDRPDLALIPLERSQANAQASDLLDQSLPQCDRAASAKAEQAIAEQFHRCIALEGDRCERKQSDGPAIEVPALQKRPNPLEVYVPSSLFVMGEAVAGGVPSQTTTTDPPHQPHQPRRRKRSSHRSQKAGVSFCLADAS